MRDPKVVNDFHAWTIRQMFLQICMEENSLNIIFWVLYFTIVSGRVPRTLHEIGLLKIKIILISQGDYIEGKSTSS